ncbi:hypothetical protein QN277_028046 [Acacia crassicarpa]|uniref:Reverse transcriptase domain-containing protein n=1 Tax=Acacia crassicarpa TaxID=499986 RepID=A0AAE1J2F3_9FABA|nr:hypothetical protein QN277_028046 [Acacia crassicarpa]
MWIWHDDFGDFIRHVWPANSDINASLETLQPLLSSWNKEVFGMIEQNKQRILKRLDGIQRSSGYPHSDFLAKLEIELQTELERLLELEEIKWFQKSRSEWIANGDRNTKFYHLKAKIRSRRNKILMLKDEFGRWVSNENELRSLVTSHFKNIYCSDPQDAMRLATRSTFPVIGQQKLCELSAIPLNDEIKAALFSMGTYKAPGIDGFPPLFYKSNWATVGSAVCDFVKKVFKREVSLQQANQTLISLIPKRESVESVSHFRPISLCTVHYKCITKVLAMRLRGVMKDLISPFQSSFIKGRCIQDNILVGQEILHIMGKNRSKKGLMAMKIDLEKAYDRIS